MSQASSTNSCSGDTIPDETWNQLSTPDTLQAHSSVMSTVPETASAAPESEEGEQSRVAAAHISRRQSRVAMLRNRLERTILRMAEDMSSTHWRVQFVLAKPMGRQKRQRRELAIKFGPPNEPMCWLTKHDLPGLQRRYLGLIFRAWLEQWGRYDTEIFERKVDGLKFIYHWVVLKGMVGTTGVRPRTTDLLKRLHDRMVQEDVDPGFDRPEGPYNAAIKIEG